MEIQYIFQLKQVSRIKKMKTSKEKKEKLIRKMWEDYYIKGIIGKESYDLIIKNKSGVEEW